jgi:hypothetical protein
MCADCVAGAELLAAVFTRGSACLVNNYRRKLWEEWLESVPKPLSKDLTGGIGKTFDLVQVIVVQPLHDRIGHLLDFAIIDQIPPGRIDFTFDYDVKPERMPM